jgi:hypothetical protein
MSQVSKLSFVDGKIGAPTSGQQTTRILFNTIENPGTSSSLVFFRNFQGLTNGQTNLTQNKLDSMESMVIKTVTFAQFTPSEPGRLDLFGGSGTFANLVFSIIVGNQTVVKNLPIHFNQGLVGQAFDRLHENAGAVSSTVSAGSAKVQNFMPCEIRLLTDIVIPPQVSFEVRVDALNADFQTQAVVCALSGYGKIFSAGNSF